MDPSHPHLVVVVHGVGDMMYDDSPLSSSLERRVHGMQQAVARMAHEDSRTAPIFRWVEWHRSLHAAWAPLIQHAVPQTASHAPSPVRVAVNDTIGDLMMFMAPRSRERLLDNVAAQIRCQYALVRATEVSPGCLWNGPVSIFAHSLGGLITFETLNANLLDTLPLHAVYTAGSPLPAYLSLQQDGLLTLKNTLLNPASPRFYNLFHPMDPVSYRLEPFLFAQDRQDGEPPRCPPPILVPRDPGFFENLSQGVTRAVATFLEFLLPAPVSTNTPKPRLPRAQLNQASLSPSAPERPVACPNVTMDDALSDCSPGSSLHTCPSAHDLLPHDNTKTSAMSHQLTVEESKDELVTQWPSHHRFDYEIDDSVLDGPAVFGIMFHWSALMSHFSYWTSNQVMRFLYHSLSFGL